MTPENFRARFIAALPPIPPDLGLQLDKFSLFPAAYLVGYHLSAEDHHLLSEVGLPDQAAPFLSFGAYRGAFDWLPGGFLPIGGDGGEGCICLEAVSGQVVLIDMECPTATPVFLNRTLLAFAECLCVYQEHRTAKSMDECFARMVAVDPALDQQGQWWRVAVAQTRVA